MTKPSLLVPLLLVPLSACGGSKTATPLPSVTVSPSVAASVSVSASPSPVATSAAAVPVCLSTDVSVRVTSRDQLVGQAPNQLHEGTVLVTNTSSYACTTAGTPGVVLLGDDGRPVEEKVEDRTTQQYGQPPQTVVLQPGGVASFAFQRSDGTPGDGFTCTHVSDALVSLPGSTDSQRSGISFTGCDTGHGLPLLLGALVDGPSATLG